MTAFDSATSPPRRSNFASPAALARFYLATIVGLTIDLWSKSYAWKRLVIAPPVRDESGRLYVLSDAVHFLPGWLHFKVTVNEGAVFGLGQGNQPLFVIVSVLALGFLTWLFAVSGKQRFYQFILGLLLAGVLGNMYDRIRFGYVRDMIYILPGKMIRGREAFPWIFNVADSLLCVGVALMVLYSLFAPREKPTQDPPTIPTNIEPVQ